MERLKSIKENLIACVQSQMGNLQNADSKELGEAIDMIKDLEEALYYCSITKAMEDRSKQEELDSRNSMYYRPIYYPTTYTGDTGRMYYNGSRSISNNSGYDSSMRGYDSWEVYPTEMRDYREGRSPIRRRNYMESKELHQDKEYSMEELDKYAQELTSDIMEMVHDATPEEKEMLSKKLTTLASKIK